MCLPGGKAISMVLQYQFGIIPKTGAYTGRDVDRRNIFSIANALLAQDHPEAFAHVTQQPFVTAPSTGSISTTRKTIPAERVPTMVFFENASDLHSAHLFDPKSPERWLGPASKFLGATLAVTNAPVQSDSAKCLTWLKYCQWGKGLIAPASAPVATDPIVRDTNDSSVQMNWCAYFTYRSSL